MVMQTNVFKINKNALAVLKTTYLEPMEKSFETISKSCPIPMEDRRQFNLFDGKKLEG